MKIKKKLGEKPGEKAAETNNKSLVTQQPTLLWRFNGLDVNAFACTLTWTFSLEVLQKGRAKPCE